MARRVSAPRKLHWPFVDGRRATPAEIDRHIVEGDAYWLAPVREVGPHFCHRCGAPSEKAPCASCSKDWPAYREQLRELLEAGPPKTPRAPLRRRGRG